jgi:hypothetical protein
VLGIDSVMVRVVDFTDIEARLWAISENLHRVELTVVQRAEQVAEYAELAKQKRDMGNGQLAHNPRGGRPETTGEVAAATALGITREEVRRAHTIASLPETTKDAARSLGYDDNQAALLAASKAPTTEEQIGVLKDIAARGSVAAATRAAPQSNVVANERGTAAKPLRSLENLSGGELARWVKITTPNDRPHVIRVLETAASILRDELNAGSAA